MEDENNDQPWHVTSLQSRVVKLCGRERQKIVENVLPFQEVCMCPPGKAGFHPSQNSKRSVRLPSNLGT